MSTLLADEFNNMKHGSKFHKLNALMAQMVSLKKNFQFAVNIMSCTLKYVKDFYLFKISFKTFY